MAERLDLLIGPHMTVREAVLAYPGIEAVFERQGAAGCGGSEGPIEPIRLLRARPRGRRYRLSRLAAAEAAEVMTLGQNLRAVRPCLSGNERP